MEGRHRDECGMQDPDPALFSPVEKPRPCPGCSDAAASTQDGVNTDVRRLHINTDSAARDG